MRRQLIIFSRKLLNNFNNSKLGEKNISSYCLMYREFSTKNSKSPQLNSILTYADKSKLKKAKITLKEISQFVSTELSQLTNIPVEKCEKIIALSNFQKLQGVSIKTSLDLWDLGYRSLKQLAGANPKVLYNRMLERKKSQDPCVEDTFRGAIAQCIALTKYNVELPKHEAQWWKWCSMRGQGLEETKGRVESILDKPNSSLTRRGNK